MNTKELKAEVERLQSELTKARELFKAIIARPDIHYVNRINKFLAHQSEPAAKGGE